VGVAPRPPRGRPTAQASAGVTGGCRFHVKAGRSFGRSSDEVLYGKAAALWSCSPRGVWRGHSRFLRVRVKHEHVRGDLAIFGLDPRKAPV